jgi:hypothetical protein
MTIRRLPDPPEEPVSWVHTTVQCYHPEHSPPTMLYLRPGRYEHMCPGCKKTVVFTVQGPFLWG